MSNDTRRGWFHRREPSRLATPESASGGQGADVSQSSGSTPVPAESFHVKRDGAQPEVDGRSENESFASRRGDSITSTTEASTVEPDSQTGMSAPIASEADTPDHPSTVASESESPADVGDGIQVDSAGPSSELDSSSHGSTPPDAAATPAHVDGISIPPSAFEGRADEGGGSASEPASSNPAAGSSSDSDDEPGGDLEVTAGQFLEAKPGREYESVHGVASTPQPAADPSNSGATPEGQSSPEEDTPLAQEIADMTRRRQALTETPLPLPQATRVFTISNQKGGVGKTTTTVNLAAALSLSGAKVLVIDLDPQGNASTALGVEHRSDTPSVYDVIIGDIELGDVIQASPERGDLDCVPATIHLAGAEIELVSLVAREQRLRRALDEYLRSMDDPYDYVFIDCPPSLGLLTINAFVAASEVLIPIQCEYYALEGLSQLLKNIELIEKHLNPDLAVSTILLTMYDSRTNLANQVAQDVRDHFPQQVLDAIIPRSVRVSEAPSYGQSVIGYDPQSSGSLSYLEAAAEIARRGAPATQGGRH